MDTGHGPAARRWAAPDLTWPLDGPALALALYRKAATPRSLIDGEGRLAGFGGYYFKRPNRLRLARQIVDPARRGQRLVDTLIHQLVDEAEQRRTFEMIELGVFADNYSAIQAYRRLGFAAIDDTTHSEIITMQRRPSP